MKLRFAFGLLLSIGATAQTVPPNPIIQSTSISGGVVTVKSNAPKCLYGSNACGLSDCGCWIQLWRAKCSSPTSCPAIDMGGAYNQVSTGAITSSTDDGTGGTNFVMQDTDTALMPGTTWNYFETVNYEQYTPWTPTGPSNASGPQTIPQAAGTIFSVYLDFDNPSCITSSCSNGLSICTCTAQAYRALCSTPTNCPAYSPGSSSFTKLPLVDASGNTYVTITQSNSGSHFRFKDDGAIAGNIGYGKPYRYAVTNTFTQDPNKVESPSMGTTVNTPLHAAVINFVNPGCNTTTKPCNLQVYRTVCPSPSTCPTYPSGTWAKLSMANAAATVGVQATSWRVSDTDPALAGSTTYSWIGVNGFQNGTSVSGPSAPYIATTNP